MTLTLRNSQQAEAPQVRDDGALEVVSVFRTLQGEGPFAGRPAVFVRLAGCDLCCPSCDTDYTEGRRLVQLTDLITEIDRVGNDGGRCPDLLVITGGEPFRQDPSLLAWSLIDAWDVQVETNGTLPCEGLDQHVTVVCSPKTALIHHWAHARADHWKYVLSHDAVDAVDGLPAKSLGMWQRPGRCLLPDRPVWVQPADAGDAEVNKLNVEAAVQSCLKFGHRLCLQTHKIVGLD